jgi:hypothetical protein
LLEDGMDKEIKKVEKTIDKKMHGLLKKDKKRDAECDTAMKEKKKMKKKKKK